MELMAYNIKQNKALFSNHPPVAVTLDWDGELPQEILGAVSQNGFDAILCVAAIIIMIRLIIAAYLTTF